MSETTTQEEIERYMKAFAQFDQEEKGSIDIWELKNALTAVGESISEEEFFQVLGSLDESSDCLSILNLSNFILSAFGEFMDCIKNLKRRRVENTNEYDVIDAFIACGGNPDKTGTASREMLKKVIVNDFGMTFDVDALFDSIETTDEEGNIEYDSFKKIMNPNL